jgi:hypothetical protein
VTGLNYPKAASRDAGRYGERYRSTGDGKPSTTEEEVKRILLGPDAIRCHGCSDHFVTTGEEPRPRPIHLCPGCRSEIEVEADLNTLPLVASDDDLRTALATIARLEGRLVRAKRQRRRDRLNGQIEGVRRDLHSKMSGSIWERAAA